MSEPRLSVEGLSKRYLLRRPSASDANPSRFDRIRKFFDIPLASELLNAKELWALKDVSLTVDPGSVLGIVGSNGAGKTTLLKILARVISPTSGRVRGKGRVVSLLELGAGFDDEATARENIYMNAALNGIPRDVVQRRFDQIIEFADLTEFVDTRVHFYSSGMYLRLAFSVAINMEPSVLLADEILAVGDVTFQERCLQKVHELASEQGLTVLFVSHDMEAISRVSDRVIWLKEGQLHRDGQPEEVVTEYQNAAWAMIVANAAANPDFRGSSHAGKFGEIIDVKLVSADGREIGAPRRGEEVDIRIRFLTHRAKTQSRCTIELFTKGTLVLRSSQPQMELVRPDQSYEARVRIPANLLADTAYTVNAAVTLVKNEDDEHTLVKNKALSFMVYGDEDVNAMANALQRKGVIDPQLTWTLEQGRNVVRA